VTNQTHTSDRDTSVTSMHSLNATKKEMQTSIIRALFKMESPKFNAHPTNKHHTLIQLLLWRNTYIIIQTSITKLMLQQIRLFSVPSNWVHDPVNQRSLCFLKIYF
jgi:hypothetical protein